MNQNLYPHLFQPLTIRGVEKQIGICADGCSEV